MKKLFVKIKDLAEMKLRDEAALRQMCIRDRANAILVMRGI